MNKPNQISLAQKANGLHHPISILYKGVYKGHPLAPDNLLVCKEILDEIKTEFLNRNGNHLPDGIADTYRVIDYILLRLSSMITKDGISQREDAEVFVFALDQSIKADLIQFCKESDEMLKLLHRQLLL